MWYRTALSSTVSANRIDRISRTSSAGGLTRSVARSGPLIRAAAFGGGSVARVGHREGAVQATTLLRSAPSGTRCELSLSAQFQLTISLTSYDECSQTLSSNRKHLTAIPEYARCWPSSL
ncbi:hypothetical protein PHLGIDRAFT_389767 [Phlebiopsis gigantea 11061_1 CR5-6]|uniref:Uncharacterized protein n=1 Tax=Phlebiopsis gigantea (strain 11061_1 CR5-6) TaxID=745531 RepID=A0A0C3S9C1_PHLG1|nr:hypothetical protein PHLGIDRAFT_389767 [Phlebiopsis gigantea 11061_1 CR5-6]